MRPHFLLEPFGLTYLSKGLHRAFLRLDRRQQLISVLRLGSSLFAIICVIIMLALRGNPKEFHVSRLNCGHLDVALGLYNTLRNSLTSSHSDQAGEIIPIDSGMTDSEITILTDYTEKEVSNAPQYIDLGVESWCTYSYVTDFSQKNYIRTNLTTACYSYNNLSGFDFRSILLDVGLDIILAYAYETSETHDSKYMERVANHAKAFKIMRSVYPIQLTCHIILILGGIYVYCNRDKKKHTLIAMNVLAVMSIIAGITMAVSTGIIVRVIESEKDEVQRGLGSFGIHLISGRRFFTLLWLVFGSSIFCMLSWIIPLWCNNAPEDSELMENERRYVARSSTHVSDYKVKPYVLHRQTRTFNAATRLFDEEMQFMASEETSEDNTPAKSSSETETTETTKRVHSESELRQLGEKLTRNYSMRKFNGPPKQQRYTDQLPPKSDTRDLLYGNNPFSNHQYPQPFPRPVDDSSVSRSSSTVQREDSVRTRLLLRSEGSMSDLTETTKRVVDDEASVLDETEMAFLDGNNFINKMEK